MSADSILECHRVCRRSTSSNGEGQTSFAYARVMVRMSGVGETRDRSGDLVFLFSLLYEYREQQPDDGGAGEQRIDAVQDAAVAGQERAHVLDRQVPLDHRLGQGGEDRGGDGGEIGGA